MYQYLFLELEDSEVSKVSRAPLWVEHGVSTPHAWECVHACVCGYVCCKSGRRNRRQGHGRLRGKAGPLGVWTEPLTGLAAWGWPGLPSYGLALACPRDKTRLPLQVSFHASHGKGLFLCAPRRRVTCCPRPGAKACSGTKRVRTWR